MSGSGSQIGLKLRNPRSGIRLAHRSALRQKGFDVVSLPNPAAYGSHPDSIPDTEHLMTPGEVAALFRVDPKTVTRWAKSGKLASIRTLGGHRRYRSSEVKSLLEKSGARLGDTGF